MNAFRFHSIFKPTIWGGNKIASFKHVDSDMRNIGESWEVSGVKDNETTVDGGEYDGLHLNELVGQLKDKLVGHQNYERFGNHFPLLIKFIDANQPLSIQVHPNDEIAHKLGYANGKTEMWYVMKSDKDASLLLGLKEKISPDQYKNLVKNDRITDVIAHYNVQVDDCFFIPAGCVHAIGKGCFLCEIQQTSDVTFRIYDYKRKDSNGNYRKLHTEEAAMSINFNTKESYKQSYKTAKNKSVLLVDCPHFKTLVCDVDDKAFLDLEHIDSFVIIIATEGSGKLTDNEGNLYSVEAGDTLLFPAVTKNIEIEGTIKLLETYV